MASLDQFAGKRVTVMGLGQFGGGLGAVRFLLDRGARVTVTDLRTAEELEPTLLELDSRQPAEFVLGEHRERDFIDADLIVVNPAVRPDNRFPELARRHGVPLTGEMSLFWERCRGRKIAVTGTVGKSTTTTLIHQCLQAAGLPTRIGGNIGLSLLPEVDTIGPEEWIVLELSSFQLTDLDRLGPRPEIAVVTNFFPNHLDWHDGLDEYRRAKQTLLSRQTPQDVAVLPADDPDVRQWPTQARRISFGRTSPIEPGHVRVLATEIVVAGPAGECRIPIDECSPDLRFAHQQLDLAAAVATLTCGLGIPPEAYRSALRDFQALPHRFQIVRRLGGRTFINDSKATTPEATIAALEACREPIILIAGGKDKGIDLSPLAAVIADRVQGVALLGRTAPLLRDRLPQDGRIAVVEVAALEEAVHWAWERSRPGDVILLSPGCASDVPFANYERRGDVFAAAVTELREASPAPVS